ncbi:MAG: creatininase family protein [Gemmatimonadales bacterium]|jgi:creatinine amidohydrolase/Fe(II)-dependent formamide hydrolase-like protein|nr:MAG: creatininase family protein [Gemmatimonadales bacterium]
MDHESRPLRIKEMHPTDVRARISHRPALIIPVGSTEQHGAHLPLGTDTLIVDRLADDISARFQILRAPTIEFGVNVTAGPPVGGGASLRRKTLHRFMNELIESWEEGAGIREFFILTAEGFEPHQEALSTVVVTEAQVQVIDVFAMQFGHLLERPGGPVHGGELDTSLLLFIAPHLVRMEVAQDTEMPAKTAAKYSRGGRMRRVVGLHSGIGHPSLASAEKGQALYQFMFERVAERCFTQQESR